MYDHRLLLSCHPLILFGLHCLHLLTPAVHSHMFADQKWLQVQVHNSDHDHHSNQCQIDCQEILDPTFANYHVFLWDRENTANFFYNNKVTCSISRHLSRQALPFTLERLNLAGEEQTSSQLAEYGQVMTSFRDKKLIFYITADNRSEIPFNVLIRNDAQDFLFLPFPCIEEKRAQKSSRLAIHQLQLDALKRFCRLYMRYVYTNPELTVHQRRPLLYIELSDYFQLLLFQYQDNQLNLVYTQRTFNAQEMADESRADQNALDEFEMMMMTTSKKTAGEDERRFKRSLPNVQHATNKVLISRLAIDKIKIPIHSAYVNIPSRWNVNGKAHDQSNWLDDQLRLQVWLFSGPFYHLYSLRFLRFGKQMARQPILFSISPRANPVGWIGNWVGCPTLLCLDVRFDNALRGGNKNVILIRARTMWKVSLTSHFQYAAKEQPRRHRNHDGDSGDGDDELNMAMNVDELEMILHDEHRLPLSDRNFTYSGLSTEFKQMAMFADTLSFDSYVLSDIQFQVHVQDENGSNISNSTTFDNG